MSIRARILKNNFLRTYCVNTNTIQSSVSQASQEFSKFPLVRALVSSFPNFTNKIATNRNYSSLTLAAVAVSKGYRCYIMEKSLLRIIDPSFELTTNKLLGYAKFPQLWSIVLLLHVFQSTRYYHKKRNKDLFFYLIKSNDHLL